MLKRFYADNYRCLVNFEIKFDELTLLVGPNGGGKSTLFDVLFKIQHLIMDNAKVTEDFQPESRTAWMNKDEQTFELDVDSEEGLFSYKLIIRHTPDHKKQRIEIEQLLFNGNPLFEFNKGEVKLYHDDHTPGPTYTFDWSVSALATIVPRVDNKKLTWFKKWVETLFIISLQPKAMSSETEEESAWLNRDGTNFASWYRYHAQENPDKIWQLTEQLRDIIPGFSTFKLEQSGKYRILKAGFNGENDNGEMIFFGFEDLSDGQRVLIVLYALLFGLKNWGLTLFIDEPENYVALPEIQPWLMEIKDACGDGFPQAVFISHHPEFIDYFGPECGKWIEHEPLGPTRVKDISGDNNGSLKLSEQIARGWRE